MNLFPFQIEAASQIAERFQVYYQNPLLVTRSEILPFYQNLSSITGSGKTLILVEAIVNVRALLPLEPIVLWISKGKVVVEQTLHNLSNGKYAASLGNFDVKPLLEATKDDIEDSSKGLMLIATVAKFNQKDRAEGDRRIFRAELDINETSLWDTLKNRWNSENKKRPLVIVYDEGHNLSNQQTKLLMEQQPDAILAASATIKVPTELGFAVERLRVEKKWTDEDFFVRVKSSDAVASRLIKQNIQLGGYLTPMEVAVSEMHEDMKLVEQAAEAENLNFSPKAIYVTSTNVVDHAVVEDSNTTPFYERKARPIVIWRYLVEELGVDPCDIHEEKFDAKIEYNSLAADALRQSAVDVVDTFLEHAEVVQSYAEPEEVPEMTINPADFKEYRNSIHKGYSGLNNLERDFAVALDANGNAWCRNPSRGFFEIPLLDKGRTKNFNPDFLVWSGKTAIFAIDTKGDHLIKEDSARKLFHVKKLGKGPDVFIRLVTKGEWNNQIQKIGSSGYTVWVLRNGTTHPIKVQNVEEAVKVCLREN